MRLIISDEAENGFDRIGAWIARDNPRRAASYVAELRKVCEALLTFPNRFPWADESLGVRKRTYGDYLILYKVGDDDDIVTVIAVEHAARDLSRLL
ncbi:type II toxin-antitoxin system RelE/ParE family toxin [Sphingomonas sp.]|uniref:type II toxin-antitoxin system RelE/ParE family toxin n=1 Tax=Sphingomonas sp. TaxID=28214 RepID=UPI0035BC42FE